VGVLNVSADDIRAPQAEQKDTISQRLFSSPDEAGKALQAAVEAKDKVTLKEIFGPEVKDLLTGDETQDANNVKRFATIMSQGYTLVKESDDKITVEIGTKKWPMPIPLVKSNGQWYFNTAEGKEEIINRHIGKDELHAIGVCRAYVTAQQQYAEMNPDASRDVKYARKFKSTSGKMDGLYWASAENEKTSLFGPLVAEADADGYAENKGSGPHPYHGYYFRVLTRQGKTAPGGSMNYMDHYDLTKGFALVAYPAHWDKSGIMTFIVNQKAQVYQQNLGEKTLRIAEAMKEYNPDKNWTPVSDTGMVNTVSENKEILK
jgi:hypothetical protein